MFLGKLDKRVTIQQYVLGSPQQTPSGAPDGAWADVATVWASLEPLSGREILTAEAIGSEISVRIRIRYRSGMTAAMRIVCDGLYYNIVSVPPLTRQIYKSGMVLMCKQGLNDG